MIIGLKSPGPECAHRSALAHRDWLSSSHRRGARRSPPVAALPYSVFGLHRNLRCRCDLAPTRQSIGNSFHAGAGWGIFFAFCLPPLKILGIKVLTRVRFDAQGRPEFGVGRGGVYSVGPTPTLPLVRGYHSAATQKSRESAGDAVFGRRSVDRTEGSKKLNSG